MSGAGGLEIDIVNPGFGEFVAEILRSPRPGRTDPEEQHLHFLVEGCWIRKSSAAGGFEIEAPASSAAACAEASEVSKFVEVFKRVRKPLRAAQGEPGHGPILTTWQHSVGPLEHG